MSRSLVKSPKVSYAPTLFKPDWSPWKYGIKCDLGVYTLEIVQECTWNFSFRDPITTLRLNIIYCKVGVCHDGEDFKRNSLVPSIVGANTC